MAVIMQVLCWSLGAVQTCNGPSHRFIQGKYLHLFSNDSQGTTLFTADLMWDIIGPGEKPFICNSHCYTLSIWDLFRWITLRWNREQHRHSASVTKCVLVEYNLGSCHIITPTVDSLQPSLHHVMTPVPPLLHLLRYYTVSTGDIRQACFSQERVEVACGPVVVVLLSV